MERLLNKKWFAAVGAVLCTVLWGSAHPVIKYSYSAFGIDSVADRLVFAGLRFFIAGAAVLVIASVKRRGLPTVPRDKTGWVVLYGLLQTGLLYLCNYIGLANTTGTKTSILTAASAFFAVMFAPLFFKSERLTALKVIGAVIGMAGIVAVNTDVFGSGFSLMGEGLVLAGTLMNTAGSFVGKHISKGRVFEMTAYQLLTGSAVLLAVGLIMGGSVSFSPGFIGVTLYLAFVSAAAFALWTALLTRHEAGRILVFNLLIPITGALWSLAILGEREILDPMYLLSVILIAGGILLVNYNKKF